MAKMSHSPVLAQVPFSRSILIERTDFDEDAPKDFFRFKGVGSKARAAACSAKGGWGGDEKGNLLRGLEIEVGASLAASLVIVVLGRLGIPLKCSSVSLLKGLSRPPHSGKNSRPSPSLLRPPAISR